MTEQEVAAVKTENARLNQLITILLEQNEALKLRIAFLEKGNTSPDRSSAFAENGNGNSAVGSAFAENGNGNPNDSISVAENRNGNFKSGSAVIENGNGNTDNRIAIAENARGNTEVEKPLPVFLPVNLTNVRLIYAYLKHNGFNKVRHDAINNAAKLLLHFYNKGEGGYPELKKLTGLSKYGLAKYIRSLKKRGLIERDGWQKFKPTVHGVWVLKKVGCTA
jgi:hypothetical protein